jgi:acyl-CoA dehydrogenase
MSGAGPAKTAEIAASVETFVREIVIPYEKDPRQGPHGPTDDLVNELERDDICLTRMGDSGTA